jgi:RNA polymerase sigma-70 factor (ECF subfamily)
MHPTDADLVAKARNGDRQAFGELMSRYQQRVYWTARRIVGSHADADDIAQETFVKAYLAIADFREEAEVFTWLYRIAVNLSLNAVRKRQVIHYLRDSEILRRVLPDPDHADREAEEHYLAYQLQRAVAKLPEKQRAVFVLRYHENLSYAEIAKILKTSVGGLKANYFHALRKLRELLKDAVVDR